MRKRWRRRFIEYRSRFRCFKPCGLPLHTLENMSLKADEFEALRLADYEGLYHEECAKRMNISRTTFGRTIDLAHKKLIECLLYGKVLIIEEGGDFDEDSTANE